MAQDIPILRQVIHNVEAPAVNVRHQLARVDIAQAINPYLIVEQVTGHTLLADIQVAANAVSVQLTPVRQVNQLLKLVLLIRKNLQVECQVAHVVTSVEIFRKSVYLAI